jgi:hypothetical protein
MVSPIMVHPTPKMILINLNLHYARNLPCKSELALKFFARYVKIFSL